MIGPSETSRPLIQGDSENRVENSTAKNYFDDSAIFNQIQESDRLIQNADNSKNQEEGFKEDTSIDALDLEEDENCQILIIDDNHLNTEAVIGLLQQFGLAASSAMSGA